MKIPTRVFVFALLAAIVSAGATGMAQDKMTSDDSNTSNIKSAVIHTNHGDITIEFYRDAAPKTVNNWVQLAQQGYYDGVIFHRIINGFMMQGGDPTGTGSGGKSIYGATFEDEIDRSSELYQTGYKRGIVAMANRGPNTNGSQFFIMHKDYGLQPNYTIFAHVTDGMDVVDEICSVKVNSNNKPLNDVVMEKITLKK